MTRIVNEAGRYDPQVTAVPETVEVDPALLPQVKPDAYAEVDHRDFSTASSMNRVQQLTMAQIAHARGDADAAARWKMQAHQSVLDDERASEAQRMNEMLAPQPSTHTPGPLAEIKSDVPWENDPDYLELSHERGELKEKMEGLDPYEDDYFKLSGKMAVLDDKMVARKGELREALAATGAWGEQDERALAARSSLGEKASQVTGMFPGHTPFAGTDGES